MKHLVPCVEQLDRAALELREGTPVSSRLALILTDNIVELVAHRKCQSIFNSKGAPYLRDVDDGTYSRIARHRVLGQHFDEKNKFLLREGEITHPEFEFIRICHGIRGEAYHSGLTHEEIMLPLAWEYHQLACDLFSRLRTGSRVYSLSATYSARFDSYAAGHTRGSVIAGNHLDEAEIANKLNAARPMLEVSLQEALARNLLAKVDRIDEMLNYLAEGNPWKYDKQQCLVDSQHWEELFANIPPEIEEGTNEYGEFIQKRSIKMNTKWTPRFSSLPTENWKRRIERIRANNISSSLIGYEQLNNEIGWLLSAVESSAGALDQYVEEQIERMREERR